MKYQIKKVEKKDLDDFIKFQWVVYKNYPNWVPPLISEIRFIFSDKNPFWDHARKELFIALDENQNIVGRISAIINEAHNKIHNDEVGFFGFFESINDIEVASLLWDGAKNWLKENGMKIIRGPVNPSMNDECGFLLEGYDLMPAIMMPYTPPYYIELAERYGFKKAKDLYALIKYTKDGIPQRIERMIGVIIKKTGVKIRTLDMKNFERDISILKDIYNSAWERNWGFVPMTEAEINLAAKKFKEFVDPSLVVYAEIDNNPVGVAVTIPDIAPILKKMNGKLGPIEILKFLYYKKKIKGVRSLIGGVKKEHRNTGIIAALYYQTEINARKRGYEWCELGWNLEDNDLINRFDMAIGGKIYKKYRIFEKEIN